MAVLGAYGGAFPAFDAAACAVKKLFARVLRFRIMAPCAAQRAALEEYGGANAWTVVQAKAL